MSIDCHKRSNVDDHDELCAKRQRLSDEQDDCGDALDFLDQLASTFDCAESVPLETVELPQREFGLVDDRHGREHGVGGTCLSQEDLRSADYKWTIIDGRVYSIDEFISHHPGGDLIRRCIGMDGTDLFHSHHVSPLARAVLVKYDVGRVDFASATEGSIRKELNQRVAELLTRTTDPFAELIAILMLCLFVVWAVFVYVKGHVALNVCFSWFWWRHFDAGLHSAVHGDFRHSNSSHCLLLRIYSVLCHHMLDHYQGKGDNAGGSQHFQHHLHTNDAHDDPDWTVFAIGRNWIRRQASNPWHQYNRWQTMYGPFMYCLLQPVTDLFTMLSTCCNGAAQMFEAPASAVSCSARLKDVSSWWLEALLSPGYQGIAFFFQPWGSAMAALLASKALSKLILLPHAEVQHCLVPELEDAFDSDDEFVLRQLRSTANLRLDNPLARGLDFCMFHGDSLQIEHHLWPAMSFVELRKASKLLKRACIEMGLPYHEVGYWQAFVLTWKQVRRYAQQPDPSVVNHDVRSSSI